MPGRIIPLINNQFYHVLNRGIASQPVFLGKRNYERVMEAIFYYQNKNTPLSFSTFLKLSNERRKELIEKLRSKKDFLIEIVCFCLMPNHLHLLLKQLQENGISIFMSNLTNSYTRYFNKVQKRIGPLFQGKFKAIRVESNEQLLHLSRYIHLNPFSDFVLKNLKELDSYPYSSFLDYLGKKKDGYCLKEIILANFKDKDDYKKFILDQANYQRELQKIKYLTFEE